MSVLYIALPAAILLGGAGLIACLYCIRSGQYDDLDSPAVRMLIEDHPDGEPARESDSVRAESQRADSSARALGTGPKV
jgi:cbb3-type cytochrome oxidase maturation protein